MMKGNKEIEIRICLGQSNHQFNKAIHEAFEDNPKLASDLIQSKKDCWNNPELIPEYEIKKAYRKNKALILYGQSNDISLDKPNGFIGESDKPDEDYYKKFKSFVKEIKKIKSNNRLVNNWKNSIVRSLLIKN